MSGSTATADMPLRRVCSFVTNRHEQCGLRGDGRQSCTQRGVLLACVPRARESAMRLSAYDPGEFYDELYEGVGQPRPGSALLLRKLASLPEGDLKKRQQAAERVILNMGMTFGVYGSDAGHEKIFPFDIVPRIIEPSDWEHIEAGLRQRMHALNLFINDVYH
ncbi:MAG: hypothetical protein FJ247_13510, partial [Nitrospira sp.]|nr:hypothetical protein [Nitrospira sp.]